MAEESRRLVTDKGFEVVTSLTDAEAYEVLAPLVGTGRLSDFGTALALDYQKFGARMTPNKMAWLHAYALEALDTELSGSYGYVNLRPARRTGPRRRS